MVIEDMERDATEHGATFTSVGLDNFLCPEKEDYVVEVVSFQQLAYEVAGIPDPEVCEEEEHPCEEEAEFLSAE